jgi:hypothetical protein
MLPRIISLLAGILFAAAVAEAVLHGLPYSTGYGALAINAEHPIAFGTAHKPYTYSRDWSFHFANSGVLNTAGFRATYDYVPDPTALAVIGNSFVQADALTPDLRMTERLGSILDRKAYTLGFDGFSLADYLAAAEWAVAEFRTRTLLVLLTTEDLARSCQPHPGQHYLRFVDGAATMALIERPNPSLVKRTLNSSSLFRYVFDNLHAPANWIKGWQRDNHQTPATPAAPKVTTREVSEELPTPSGTGNGAACGGPQSMENAALYLLNGFRQLERSTGARVMFILAPDFHQRHAVFGIYRDVDGFADRAATLGFEVVRLNESFSAAERRGLTLDLMPIDRHWNAVANDVAARTVADFIRAHPEKRVE